VAQTVNEALAGELVALGTTALFGLVGEDTVELVTDLAAAGVRYYGARHENAAVGMADGYSWASGGLGVCTVTRGPGVLNGSLALRTAARSRRRVLAITGDMATTGDWVQDLKSLHHGPVAAAIGLEYFATADPAEVVPTFRRAAAAAAEGRTALLSIPVDVLHGPAPPVPEPEPASTLPPVERQAPTDEDVEQVVELLAGSERPLVLAGRGAREPEAVAALERLAERTGALLGTTLLARNTFAGNPYDVGIVGGYASDAAIPLLGDVDCVLAFGASLTVWTTASRTLFRGAPVVQVDADPERVGASFPVRLGIVADAGETARRLLAALPPPDGRERPFRRPEVLERLRAARSEWSDESAADELDPRVVAATLDELLPEDRAVVLDSGRHANSPGRYLRAPSPEHFRLSADAGSIGMGLGLALGAQVARPETPTVFFVGDGSLSMALGDLATAAANAIPLVVVVMNDRAYGSELVHLRDAGKPWDYARLPEIDFAAVASALGIEAATVRTAGELRALGPRLTGRTAPLLLDCRIRQDLFVPRTRWDVDAAVRA
jgi:thiamine pyrophosphate-dependent acetolactate synthase large subunit-like protein